VKAIVELAKDERLSSYRIEQGIGAEYFKDYALEVSKRANDINEACLKTSKRNVQELARRVLQTSAL